MLAKHFRSWTGLRVASSAILIAVTVQGCGASLPSLSLTSEAAPTPAAAPAAPVPGAIQATIGVEEIVGPTEPVRRQLIRKINTAADRSQLALMADRDANPDYKLRGYLMASTTKKGSELSFVWDVFDRQGNKVGRTSGIVPAVAAPQTDPWGSLPEAELQRIAEQAVIAVTTRGAPGAQQGAAAAAAAPAVGLVPATTGSAGQTKATR